MATIISSAKMRPPLAVDRFEALLSTGAVVLLACIVVAMALTPVMLLQPRGDARHRLLGHWLFGGW